MVLCTVTIRLDSSRRLCRRYCWVQSTVWVQPIPCQSSSMSLLPKIFIASFIIYWEMTKAWEVWLLLTRSVPKSAFGLMQKLRKYAGHTEEKEKKEKKAIRPRCVTERNIQWRTEIESHIRPFFLWVPERAKHRKERVSAERCNPKR